MNCVQSIAGAIEQAGRNLARFGAWSLRGAQSAWLSSQRIVGQCRGPVRLAACRDAGEGVFTSPNHFLITSPD